MNQFWWTIIQYLIFIFCVGFIFNFMTRGFMLQYLRAKASRGKKILTEVYGIGETYYVLSTITENELNYKNQDKKNKILTVKDGQVRRLMNVNFIMVDDVKNAVIDLNFNVVSGHDAQNTDNLYNRCLMAPHLDYTKWMQYLLIGIIVVGVISIAGAYLIYGVGKKINIIGVNSDTIIALLKNSNCIMNNTANVIG